MLNEKPEPENEDDDAVEDATSPELEDVLEDARKFLRACKEAESKNNTAMLDDLKFLSGGLQQWDTQDAAQRTLDGRPMITVNKLPTFLHQVTNNLRQNKTSIKVHPASSGANVDIAKVRQGIIRNIEYESSADVAYATAACSAAAIGKGYFRIITEYSGPDSFDQDIRFKRIRNPFTVHFDPMSENPDGSDAKRVLIATRMMRTEFKRLWPKAEANNLDLAIGQGDLATDWLFTDEVVIGEYYRIEETRAVLCLMEDGSVLWEDEIDPGRKKEIEPLIKARRDSFKRKVMLYKLTGCDMLEQTEIKCYWIPVFPVYGDELDIDGDVIRSGLIRHSKDSLRMYNYWMTCATEEVALRPKTPYIGAVGQFEGFETDWLQANKKSFPYLQYNPVTVEGNLAPAPQRQPTVDIPSGMLQMAMHANDNIKATTGLFDSSLGARGNATSGKQELAQQRQGDIANFHYLDGLQVSIRHAGRCINWMIPYYLDTQRVMKIMGDDDKVSTVTINQPDPLSGPIGAVLNDMTGGEYTVTVESGPPYQTLRQEAAEVFSEMAHNNMELMKVAGDLIIGEMDVPGADKIAARIKKSIPPQLTEGEDDQDPNSIDAKLQKIGQMKQLIDQQSQQMEAQAQALTETEAHVKQEMLRLKEEAASLSVQKAEINAAIQIERANSATIKAQLALATAGNGEEAVEQESLEWNKSLLQADTTITVEEMRSATTLKAKAMELNKSADGSTVAGEDGSTQASPALNALVDAVNQNMQSLMEGQKALASSISAPRRKKSKAVKQPDGSYVMETIED